jgi:hypothetical protein
MGQPYLIPPAGVSAAGFFDPYVVDPSSPPIQLADDIDPKTGEIRSLFAPVNPVHAMVQFNLSLEYSSGPATNGRGQKFKSIRKIDSFAEMATRNEIERILEPHVVAKLVGDVKISTQIPNPKNRNEGDWVLDYRELLTGLAGKERR